MGSAAVECGSSHMPDRSHGAMHALESDSSRKHVGQGVATTAAQGAEPSCCSTRDLSRIESWKT